MVVKYGEGIGLLAKVVRALLKKEDTTEDTEEAELPEKPEALSFDGQQVEPMKAYWETDKLAISTRNQFFVDSYLEGKALESVPSTVDSTEAPVKESHYKYAHLGIFNIPETRPNQRYEYNYLNGVTDAPKAGTGISSSGRDAGVVAGIVVAVISGVLILAGLIAVVLYKHYVHRNVTSMNFDNPVYRKTTEEQFALEKNGYAPGSKLYPSTVGEEAREPLNTPGTNEYV